MDYFINIKQDPVDIVEINADGISHISIRNNKLCEGRCENKPCTYYCPTGVFHWDDADKTLNVLYTRCVECLACPFGCPFGNIDWHYPPQSAGVVYKHG